MEDDLKRGTGRTTALMLRAIADALESRRPVEFIDHAKNGCQKDLWTALFKMVAALNLNLWVTMDSTKRIWIENGLPVDRRRDLFQPSE